MPIIGFVVAALVLAFGCSYFMRNTSGAHPTGQPGAMAGNLAVLFLVLVMLVIAGVAVLGITR